MRAHNLPSLPPLYALLGRSLLTWRRRGPWPIDRAEQHFRAAPLSEKFRQNYQALFPHALPTPLLTSLYPLAQRAQLALLLRSAFPIAIPGIVHLRNTMTHLHEIDWDDGFTLQVQAVRLEDGSHGAQLLNMAVNFLQQQQAVASCDSTYLVRRGRGRLVRDIAANTVSATASYSIDITAATIRQYARVSGDWNPIHLSDALARALGAPGRIAHGMYLAAEVERHLQGNELALSRLSLDFIKPVRLPARQLELSVAETTFALHQHQQLLICGHFQQQSSGNSAKQAG